MPAVRIGFAIRLLYGVFRRCVLDLAVTGSEIHPLRFDAETGQQRDDECDTRRYAREPDVNSSWKCAAMPACNVVLIAANRLPSW